MEDLASVREMAPDGSDQVRDHDWSAMPEIVSTAHSRLGVGAREGS